MNMKEAIEVLKNYRKGDFVDDTDLCEAIDTVVSFYESPPAESEEIPETLKGKAYDYMTQMKTLIKNQHTMTPDWVIAHAMSIVGRAYSAGVDFAVEVLKMEKKGEDWEAKQRWEGKPLKCIRCGKELDKDKIVLNSFGNKDNNPDVVFCSDCEHLNYIEHLQQGKEATE